MESDTCYIRQPRASKPVECGSVGRFPGGCERREGAQGVPRDCGGCRTSGLICGACYMLQLRCHAATLSWMSLCKSCQEYPYFGVHEAIEWDELWMILGRRVHSPFRTAVLAAGVGYCCHSDT